ncbi:DUF1398 domain-containing protein [Niveispirillum fermenti]|uniref:DUF1398 domain-containing protein n=1 Tax=Niveispirillum fermenti TaxID=1233113 RepID=UPI003A87774F
MDAERIDIARRCLAAAHDGTMDFPGIVGMLMDAGFEGYHVDYRCGTSTYHLPCGNHIVLPSGQGRTDIAPLFRADKVEAAVQEAQAGGPGYTYHGFCDKVAAAGCAGYMVSFCGRRVVYYGRTAETHVEHFPQ